MSKRDSASAEKKTVRKKTTRKKTTRKKTTEKKAPRKTPPRKTAPRKSAPRGKAATKPIETVVEVAFDADERHQAIAEAAFRRARERGFAPGHELDDWLAAEAEVDAARRGER